MKDLDNFIKDGLNVIRQIQDEQTNSIADEGEELLSNTQCCILRHIKSMLKCSRNGVSQILEAHRDDDDDEDDE